MTQRSFLAQQMLEHVNRQRESGMTIANYTALVGITAHNCAINSQHAKEVDMKFIDLNTLGLVCNDKTLPQMHRK